MDMGRRYSLLVATLLLAVFVAGFGNSAQAITGIGFGAKLGQVTNYDNPKLKLADAKFSDFKAYGVFAKVGSRSVDIEFGFDWSKDKQEKTLFGEKVEVEAKDFSMHATTKFVFLFPVLRPFIGGGIAAHKFSYTYSGQLGEFDEVTVSIPSDKTFLGFHLVVGAKLQLGALPFQPFVEGKISKVNSNPSTDITVISAGVLFSFL
jgi:hypothetical protein